MTTNTPGDIHLNETGERRLAPTGISGKRDPMNQSRSITHISEKHKEKFWSYIRKSPSDECWEWVGAKTPLGYGHLSIKRKKVYAHRIAFFLANGYLPAGLCVLHKCDNPGCVNPNHLWLGTYKDNTHDMFEKGRGNRTGKLVRKPFRGQAKKLTLEQAREIRAAYIPNRNVSDLAKKYGVSKSLICRIAKGKTWKEVTPC